MPQVGFELTIPVFERSKTVHTLDRAATVIGTLLFHTLQNPVKTTKKVNSVTLFRKRTILTARPPLVSEVSANFCGDRGCRVVNATDHHGR
jgi:hypothetical protein